MEGDHNGWQPQLRYVVLKNYKTKIPKFYRIFLPKKPKFFRHCWPATPSSSLPVEQNHHQVVQQLHARTLPKVHSYLQASEGFETSTHKINAKTRVPVRSLNCYLCQNCSPDFKSFEPQNDLINVHTTFKVIPLLPHTLFRSDLVTVSNKSVWCDNVLPV